MKVDEKKEIKFPLNIKYSPPFNKYIFSLLEFKDEIFVETKSKEEKIKVSLSIGDYKNHLYLTINGKKFRMKKKIDERGLNLLKRIIPKI